MRPSLRTIALAVSPLLVAFGVVLQQQPVTAQLPLPQQPIGVHITYVEPTNPAFRPIYDRLKQRQILEQFKQFMAPLRLPSPLIVSLEGCNGKVNAWYSPSQSKITYCYELIATIERLVAKSELLPGFRREDALVGGFVQILLHETSHAVFHLLDIPVFGREEDAADALAEFTLLRLGDKVARRTLTGTAFIWRAMELAGDRNRSFEDFSDEHGTHAQRFYNALCIAYGSDQVEGTHLFDDFVQRKLLPPERQGHCPKEYYHAKNSFTKLIVPHVDQAMMKKVQATDWLRSEDGTDILPPEATGGGGGQGPLGPGPTGGGTGGQQGPLGPGPGAPR